MDRRLGPLLALVAVASTVGSAPRTPAGRFADMAIANASFGDIFSHVHPVSASPDR